MGAAWCRNRVQAAQDSKSPLDRVIVRCVNQVYPPERVTTPSNNAVPVDNGVTSPMPRTEVNSTTRVTSSEWEEVSLQVPELGSTPVPPPRKKRSQQIRRKMGVSRPSPPQPPPSNENLLSPDRSRPKNLSTVSLPNFSELRETKSKKSTSSLLQTPSGPSRAPSLSSVSEATAERLENYMRRCRSFGSMAPDQLLDRLNQSRGSSSDSDDSWAGLDDWDLGVIEHNHRHGGSPPLSPTSRLQQRPRRKISAPAKTFHTKSSSAKPPHSAIAPPKPPHTVLAPVKPRHTTVAPHTVVDPLPDTQHTLPFIENSSEDDWFQEHWSSQQRGDIPTTQQNGVLEEAELSNVKKELQSIIYDYNRCKKVSTSSMEVLPTQPVRVAKKKISVASVTPPPSPEATDFEDDIPPSTIINGESGTDDSTLLRILKTYNSIEDVVESDKALELKDMPDVHKGLNKKPEKIEADDQQLLTKKRKPDILEKLKSPSNYNIDTQHALHNLHKKEDHTELSSGINITAQKLIDSEIIPVDHKLLTSAVVDARTLLNELDDKLGPKPLVTKAEPTVENILSSEEKKPVIPTEAKKLEPDGDLGSRGSSNRSSMTPSLSELEAALSDMLEKSTEDEETNLPAPVPVPVPVVNNLPKLVPKISISSEPDDPVFQDNHMSPHHSVGAPTARRAGEVH